MQADTSQLRGALEWAIANRDNMAAKGPSQLEFKLHRLVYLHHLRTQGTPPPATAFTRLSFNLTQAAIVRLRAACSAQ